MVITEHVSVYLCFDMSLLFNVHFFSFSFCFFFIFVTGFYIPENKNYRLPFLLYDESLFAAE